MIRAALLLAIVGACLATKEHYGYGYKPKSYKCFQCEYRPPVTNTYQVPREESYEVQVPVHSQECHDEQVLAGHKVTTVEKRVTSSFRPAYGYEHAAVEGYGEEHVAEDTHAGYDHHPESYEHAEPIYKTVQRCVPKVDYHAETRYRTVYDTKTEVTPAGGFEPCHGPITYASAEADGVDVWDCHSSCYTRVDAHGNISRGCYKGEFGVDPNSDLAQTVSGMTYHFCHGDFCNGA